MSAPDAAVEISARILAVDDSKLIREIIHEFFTPNGYEVIEAENGLQALELLDERIPDAIVADVLMPEMDGWALFEEVRRRPHTADIPFVFLTVEADLAQRLRGLRSGADDYMTKPFEVEELHARIECILARKRVLDEARGTGTALLTGSVEHLSMSDLLQILSLNRKDGFLELRQEDRTGTILFERGSIVHAACGGIRGLKALFRMLGWSRASFRLLPLSSASTDRTIDVPSTNALMDGLVSLDEWNRWKEQLPALEGGITESPEALARLGGHPFTPAELDVLARARLGACVGAILEGSPLPDADLAEAICTLVASGVLVAP